MFGTFEINNFKRAIMELSLKQKCFKVFEVS